MKVRLVKSQLVDTSTIVKWDISNKNIFSNPKKINSNITIKLIPKNDVEKKRIIIKDLRYRLYIIFYIIYIFIIFYNYYSVSQLVQPSENLQLSIKEAKSQIRAAMQMNNKENP